MTSKVIQGMIPPGGWMYMQEGIYPIESDSFENLVRDVQNWRMTNSRELGDPVKDIEDYICNKAPRNCHKQSSGGVSFRVIDLQSAQNANFATRIGAWGTNIYARPETRDQLPAQEAEERAKICIDCPHNQKWEHECPKCVAEAQRILAYVRGGKENPHKAKLHGCEKFNHCNRTAIFIKEQFLEKREDVPARCWLKKK